MTLDLLHGAGWKENGIDLERNVEWLAMSLQKSPEHKRTLERRIDAKRFCLAPQLRSPHDARVRRDRDGNETHALCLSCKVGLSAEGNISSKRSLPRVSPKCAVCKGPQLEGHEEGRRGTK